MSKVFVHLRYHKICPIPLSPFKSVFDNVLLEHGGLPHVLPLAVHLIFLPEQVEGVILSHFYSLSFLVRDLAHKILV